MKKVTAKCPGSCGELIQGWLGDSQKLVSYGINSYSWVTIEEGEQLFPTTGHKAQLALRKSLARLGISESFADKLSLHIFSELAVSKGMASSTADIAATCLATAAFFEKKLTLQDIIEICVEIERTDSTLFPTLTLFEQQYGSVVESSGWQPDFHVVVLEPEERITTEKFHSKQVENMFFQQRNQFKQVYEKYCEAIEEKSVYKLGTAAFESAILNQEILPKPYFEKFVDLKEQFSLLGINVAHSGSVVGLLVAKSADILPLINEIKASPISEVYSKIKVHRSCYQGVQLVFN